MAFQYQSQPLPILQPGQMNPFSQALQSGLDTFQKGMKAAYLPQNLQTDIDKKNAYVEYMRNMPMQYISSVLSNPQLVPFMSNEQRAGLIDTLARRAAVTEQPSSQLHTKEGMLDWIKNAFSSNKEEMPSQIDSQQINAMRPGDSYVVGSGEEPQQTDLGRATGYTKIPPALGNRAQDALMSTVPREGYIDPANPAANAYGRDFGNPEANRFYANKYPSPAFERQNKGLLAESTEEAKEGVKLWNEELKDINQEARSAKKGLDEITIFDNLYKKLPAWERGIEYVPFSGKQKFVRSSEAQLVDRMADNIALDIASDRFKQRITNNDLTYVQTLKTDRTLSPNAQKNMVNFLKAANQRVIEQAAFKNAAKNRGLTVPEADLVWQKYIDERPLYNTTSGKLELKNAKGWGEFLTPRKIQEALNPQNSYPNPDYMPPQEVIDSQASTTSWKRVNGKLVRG